MRTTKTLMYGILGLAVTTASAVERCIPPPPLSERWFSELCFYLGLFAAPILAVTAARHHDWSLLLLQIPSVALMCVLTVLVLKRNRASLRWYFWAVPAVVIAGCVVTNMLFLLRILL
jgi:hypothetical protein